MNGRKVIKIKLSQKDIDDRRAICASCEFKKNNKMFDYCGVCKCIIKAKTVLPAAKCPKGKW